MSRVFDPRFLVFGAFVACSGNQPLPDCPATHGGDLEGTCRLRCQGSSECLPTEECVSQLCLPRDDQGAEISVFRATELEVPLGADVHLDFVVLFADSVTITADEGGAPAVILQTPLTSGTLVWPLQGDTHFQLVASGGGKIDTADVTVTIASGDPVEIVHFTASPPRITAGTQTQLTWQIARGDGAYSISDGSGTVLDRPAQPLGVSPPIDTTYTLSASGPGGPVTAQVTVLVGEVKPVEITSVVLEQPSAPRPGDNAVLTWQTKGADRLQVFETGNGNPRLLVDTQDPVRAESGSWIVVPDPGSAYSVRAEGGGAARMVDVSPASAPIILPPRLTEARLGTRILQSQQRLAVVWQVEPAEVVVHIIGAQGELHSMQGSGAFDIPLNGTDETQRIVVRADNATGVDDVVLTAYSVFDEGVEPNDTPDSASELLGRAVRGQLEPLAVPGQPSVDWFRFELPVSGRIVAELLECSAATIFDPELDLYDGNAGSTGNVPIRSQGGPCAALESPVLSAGTYYVRVSVLQLDVGQSAPYTLGVTWLPPICGNGAMEAGEQCDEGDRLFHDSCTPLCQTDPGFALSVENRGNVAFDPPGAPLPLTIHPLGVPGDTRNRAVAIVRFPFDFPYYGHHYRGAFVYTDGYLAFAPGLSITPIGAAAPNGILAPFAGDLVLEASGSFSTFDSTVDGAAATVVDIDALQLRGQPVSHLSVRVGVSADGRIAFRYGDLRGGNQSVQAGIEDGDGVWFLPVPGCDAVNGSCTVSNLPANQLIGFNPGAGLR